MLSNNKIDTSKWVDYRVGDVFKITSGDCIKSDDTNNEENEKLIPYITRGKSLNSIDSYVHNKATQKRNCITIGTQGVTAYYQNLDFISGTGVNIIRHDRLNEDNALFICTILNKCIQKNYKFGYELSQTRLSNVKIHLPSKLNSEGKYEPDWEYMEEFIKQKEKDIEDLKYIYIQETKTILKLGRD